MKKEKKINPIVVMILVILVVLLWGGILVFLLQKNGDSDSSQGTEKTPGKQVEVNSTLTNDDKGKDGQETFVIFGVDSRTDQLGKGTRSDSIMIVHVNHDAKDVKVASVFRDCMVHIEGYNYEKITHAHSYGGPDLALSTINENFDLTAANYVTVNFNSVSELVDLLGGIEYTITDEEAGHMGFSGGGTYLLDGDEVVTYSRIRKAEGGDYKRSERQREMLFKIFEKAKTVSKDEQLEMVEIMLDEINTSYNQDEILEILYYLYQYEIKEMAAFPEVFYAGRVEGAWVEVPVTLVDMNTSLHKFLFGETEYTPSETVQEYSTTLRNKVSGANTDLRK